MKIYSHNPGSRGARALGEVLEIRVLRGPTSTWRPRARTVVVNWGASEVPAWLQTPLVRLLNRPERVARSTNKLTFFQDLALSPPKGNGDLIPPFTTSRQVAAEWVGKGETVVCRNMLRASGGAGIVIAETHDQLVNAPLYVKYIPKRDEFRVHIFQGNVIDIQQKARKLDVPDDEVDWQVRNLEGGFIYKRENIHPSGEVARVALEAMRLSGLDFGGVDVVWNGKSGRAYCLEINTAPGLEGTTVEKYANAFRSLM